MKNRLSKFVSLLLVSTFSACTGAKYDKRYILGTWKSNASDIYCVYAEDGTGYEYYDYKKNSEGVTYFEPQPFIWGYGENNTWFKYNYDTALKKGDKIYQCFDGFIVIYTLDPSYTEGKKYICVTNENQYFIFYKNFTGIAHLKVFDISGDLSIEKFKDFKFGWIQDTNQMSTIYFDNFEKNDEGLYRYYDLSAQTSKLYSLYGTDPYVYKSENYDSVKYPLESVYEVFTIENNGFAKRTIVGADTNSTYETEHFYAKQPFNNDDFSFSRSLSELIIGDNGSLVDHLRKSMYYKTSTNAPKLDASQINFKE